MTGTPSQAAGLRRAGRAGFVLLAFAGVALILTQTTGLWASAGQLFERVRTDSDNLPLLVNADHPLPDEYPEPALVALVEEVPVANKGVRVASGIEKPLLSLFASARKAGLKNLYVISGYRTADEQRALWDASDDRSYVQPAGHSEHQTGLAVDLGDLKVGSRSFGDSKAGRWLAKNAWKHGFVLRYPSGKEEVTGIAYEPWHFRYVGKEVARACHERGLTLEEYVDAARHPSGKA